MGSHTKKNECRAKKKLDSDYQAHFDSTQNPAQKTASPDIAVETYYKQDLA